MLKTAVFNFAAHDGYPDEAETYINRQLEMLELTREQVVSINLLLIEPEAGFSGRRYMMVITYER